MVLPANVARLAVIPDENLPRQRLRLLGAAAIADGDRRACTRKLAGDSTTALAPYESDAHPFDLVVLDLGLPRLDGMEVLRRLRAGGDVPVLMKGGYSKRDQDAESPTFIVESVTPFADE